MVLDDTYDLERLIICPRCDLVYDLERMPTQGQQAVCTRCRAVLIAPRRKAGMQIITLAVSIVILVGAAISFPFLSINAGGVKNAVSLLDLSLIHI